ncbi:hypothetical protein [Phycicoccus sp. Soil802]|uniref:hypothetical protein n=1 Tax=Phycicoccus sp. Soil802 TaxID=1736414 RepID=UPI000702EE9D|nr:hypothetical protein [Phycicoccus sp. Soil802]KRF27304.1 hypothetical protein ASG91_12615 [Phycicoccus sp. Soil802]
MALGAATALFALVTLSACSSTDEPSATTEQKQSADANAPQSASADRREQFLPLLRKYHDQLTWPPGRDVTPDEMWQGIAPNSGQVVLDDTAAQGEVGFRNLCAWALTAIDTVKAAKDTADVRKGLLQSQKLMPGGEAFSQAMADELVLDNIEKTQQFVAANKCDDSS